MTARSDATDLYVRIPISPDLNLTDQEKTDLQAKVADAVVDALSDFADERISKS